MLVSEQVDRISFDELQRYYIGWNSLFILVGNDIEKLTLLGLDALQILLFIVEAIMVSDDVAWYPKTNNNKTLLTQVA